MPEDALVEQPKDVGTDQEAIVRRWLLEHETENRAYKDWRKRGEEVVRRYRDEKRQRSGNRLNILWSNTEVLKPALFSNTPQPDVRRRFRDKDPVGRYAAQALERALSFSIDMDCLDETMEHAVQDYILPGRGTVRCDYEPTIVDDDEDTDVVGESVKWSYWDWRRFRHDAADCWDDVRWISYEHQMTRRELIDNFGDEKGKEVQLSRLPDRLREDDREAHAQFMATATVYEIWDKTKREVIFVSPGYKDAPLEVKPDPLNLSGFFNTPEPLVKVSTNGTLVPIPEFTLYQDQADELNAVTGRIDRLISALKARGVYDAAMEEIDTLMKGDDNELIPVQKWITLADKGGLAGVIDWVPIEQIAKVLVALYEQRSQLLELIYQITGISDVMRGASDPNETAAAQRLKGQFGSYRLKPQQTAVQRYVRDLLRLGGEIVAEKFSVETLADMTNLDLPNKQMQALAQLAMEEAQRTGQPPPPQVTDLLKKPAWEDVKGLLESDLQRGFRVDIETDSTIAPDDVSEKQSVTEFLGAIGGYFNQVAPLVAQQIIPVDVATHILSWAARKFKVSREIEDKLSELVEKLEQTGGQQGNPADAAAQVEREKIQAEAQTDVQVAQMKAQSDAQTTLEVERMKLQAQIIMKQMELGASFTEAQIEARLKMSETQMMDMREREKAMMDDDREREGMAMQDDREREAARRMKA